MRAAVPPDETERLEALRSYRVLDTPSEPDFDDLAALASFVCKTSVGLISLVDKDRQWFKARHGLDATEMHRDIAFCAHTILDDAVMVVNDTHDDRRFADNPLVLGEPYIRFYAGVPLVTSSGHNLGTVCVVDSEPHELDEQQTELLKGLARQAIAQLELRRSLVDLRRSNESKDRLFTLISHDLRSPLQTILGFSELLERRLHRLDQAEIRKYVGHVVASARRVHRLLDNLLELARFELGEMRCEPRPVGVTPVIEEVLALFASEARDKSITLEDVIEGPLRAETDPRVLQPVLRNLLSNAIKFSHPESRVITRARGQGSWVRLEVEDEGVGMPPELLAKALEGQTQGSLPGTVGEQGTGLGMMLVHRLVRQLGARLEGESTEGAGSRFVLRLPAVS